MSHGPVDLVVVRFPDTEFSNNVASVLGSMVSDGTIRVIDLLFVTNDQSGNLEVKELTDLDEDA